MISDSIQIGLKQIHGDVWMFRVRENGWVVVCMIQSSTMVPKKQYLQAIDIQSCMQFVYAYYGKRSSQFLNYGDLEDIREVVWREGMVKQFVS